MQQGDYNTARREKDKYAKTYGYNPKIESIEIPTKSNLSRRRRIQPKSRMVIQNRNRP